MDQLDLMVLGINQEQQHQELMWYDLKYILGHNPIFPAYTVDKSFHFVFIPNITEWTSFKKQKRSIWHKGGALL